MNSYCYMKLHHSLITLVALTGALILSIPLSARTEDKKPADEKKVQLMFVLLSGRAPVARARRGDPALWRVHAKTRVQRASAGTPAPALSASRRFAFASARVSPCEMAEEISSTKQVYPSSLAGSKTAVSFMLRNCHAASSLATDCDEPWCDIWAAVEVGRSEQTFGAKLRPRSNGHSWPFEKPSRTA